MFSQIKIEGYDFKKHSKKLKEILTKYYGEANPNWCHRQVQESIPGWTFYLHNNIYQTDYKTLLCEQDIVKDLAIGLGRDVIRLKRLHSNEWLPCPLGFVSDKTSKKENTMKTFNKFEILLLDSKIDPNDIDSIVGSLNANINNDFHIDWDLFEDGFFSKIECDLDDNYSAKDLLSIKKEFYPLIKPNKIAINFFEPEDNTPYPFNKVFSIKEKPVKKSIGSTLKEDGIEIVYRTTASNISSLAKKASISLVKSKIGDNEKLLFIQNFLESPGGDIAVKAAIGTILTLGQNYIPQLSDDQRIARLAKEFRVSGGTQFAEFIIKLIMEHFGPVLMQAIKDLPVESTKPKIKVKAINSKVKVVQPDESEELAVKVAKA